MKSLSSGLYTQQARTPHTAVVTMHPRRQATRRTKKQAECLLHTQQVCLGSKIESITLAAQRSKLALLPRLPRAICGLQDFHMGICLCHHVVKVVADGNEREALVQEF